jgi:hypothetical protein
MIYHPRVHFGDVGEFPLKKTIMVTSASEVVFCSTRSILRTTIQSYVGPEVLKPCQDGKDSGLAAGSAGPEKWGGTPGTS